MLSGLMYTLHEHCERFCRGALSRARDTALLGIQVAKMSGRSKLWSFVSGVGAAAVTSGVGYLVLDSMSEIATLRNCQHQVLDLAVRHEQLCNELGLPLNVGPLLTSSMNVSPSGRLVKCEFAIAGSKRSSDVSATVQRAPYASTFLYNFMGPSDWELLHCHVLIGKLRLHLKTIPLYFSDDALQVLIATPVSSCRRTE